MARTRKQRQLKAVETLTHEGENRKNIPTAEYQPVMREEELNPVQVAYERRNRDLDPQLVWRGKDEQDWSDLMVQAPPLYIQEKVHPKALIDDLVRHSAADDASSSEQINLFADFNGLPEGTAGTEFYQHDANWSNRMILGDSLQVMASLAEREGLRGQVRYVEGGSEDDDEHPRAERRAAIFVGPEFGTVSRPDLVAASREAGEANFDILVACAFSYDAHSSDFAGLGRIPVLKARMNADLHMADGLKNTGKGNLFVIFGEPDIDILEADSGHIQVRINGVDVFHPNTGEVRSDGPEGIACWFIDTDYNEESFFVRHAYFLGASDPYKPLRTTLKAEVNPEAWETLHSDTSRPFPKPQSGRIAVKVINHLGDEVMKVIRV